MGWDVTVLTVKDPLGGMMDDTLLRELPDSVRVERAWSPEPTRLVAVLRRLRRRPRGSSGEGTRGYTSLPRGAIRFVQAFFIPDEKVGWTPWAVAAARRVHAANPVDVVLATGPPFSVYGVAWRVARRLGVPWVADLRDPIVGGYFFRPHTPLHGWLMRRYERKVARRAAYVVTASEGFTTEFVTRRPEVRERVLTLTNGFDPDDFAAVARTSREGFVLSYVGTFQGTVCPDTLLDALVVLRGRGAQVVRDVRVRFVGALDPQTGEAIERRGLGDVVERVGYLPHGEAVAEMCAADVLLLVLSSEAASGDVVPGKLPEYLGAGRPVLALVPEGVAADVVRRSGAGEVVHPDDVEGAAAALERLHAQWRDGTLPVPDPAVVAEFDRSRLVERYAEILRQVIGLSRR
jgi:glycosyltransferase involved in cell wall biosynthesis